jgi:hypothetical protein
MGSREGALIFEIINRGASAHFVGESRSGTAATAAPSTPTCGVFGQPGLHVMDGSVMPANPGVNPSLTITALVERAMSLWPNKTDPDTRPPLGSGYKRIDAVMPHRPAVPAGAPRRAATRREQVRHHSRVPLLNRPMTRSHAMTERTVDDFRTVGRDDAIPDGVVVPFYLGDRKLRISIAHVDDHLYAFDDLCTCAGDSCPLSGGCSPGRRSCANVTARRSTSPPALWSAVRRRSRSASTRCSGDGSIDPA